MVPEYCSVLYSFKNVCILFILAALSPSSFPDEVRSIVERRTSLVRFKRAQPIEKVIGLY